MTDRVIQTFVCDVKLLVTMRLRKTANGDQFCSP